MPSTSLPTAAVPRILIIDGSSQQGADAFGVGALFYDLIDSLVPGAEIAVLGLATADEAAIEAKRQAPWNGVIWTADSGTASVCAAPSKLLDRALLCMESFFSRRLPQFGSAWGLHVAVLCSGGEVIVDPHRDSFPFARSLALTQSGVTHPMMRGRRSAFMAPSLHPDSIESLPSDAQVLALGAHNTVQACEIFWRGGSFWGTQYQPESDLREIALFCQRHAKTLIAERWFADAGHVAAYARRCLECQMSERRDLRLSLAIDDDITKDAMRHNELRRWLETMVLKQPVHTS